MEKASYTFLIDSQGRSFWGDSKDAAKGLFDVFKKLPKSTKPVEKKKTEEPKAKEAKKDAKEPAAVAQQADPLPSGIVTDLVYFTDTYLFEDKGKLLAVGKADKVDHWWLIFDRTVFHPQGGGQPADAGVIVSEDGKKFTVTDLKLVDKAVVHTGKFEGAQFAVGETLTQKVDGEFRAINARIHSAGHLLDIAMNRAGRTDLKPSKGYHFQEGPYVEYIGAVDEKDRANLQAELNKHCNALIAEAKAADEQVFRKMCSYEEADAELKGAGGIPSYVPAGQSIRVLKLVKEDLGCPCGGTHVHAIPEIGTIEVTKIKKKKQNVQVAYKVIPPTAKA